MVLYFLRRPNRIPARISSGALTEYSVPVADITDCVNNLHGINICIFQVIRHFVTRKNQYSYDPNPIPTKNSVSIS